MRLTTVFLKLLTFWGFVIGEGGPLRLYSYCPIAELYDFLAATVYRGCFRRREGDADEEEGAARGTFAMRINLAI